MEKQVTDSCRMRWVMRKVKKEPAKGCAEWKYIYNPGRSRDTIEVMQITRSQLRHSNPIDIGRRAKPKVSADYVVGLTDGEGCFYVLVKPPFNQNGGALVQLAFFIKMKEEDRELLEQVREALECGSVYFQHETRSNHAQCYRYTVNSHRDILGKIIPFFRENPLQSKTKQRSFEIFCQIAEMVARGEHHRREGIERLQTLKKNLNFRAR